MGLMFAPLVLLAITGIIALDRVVGAFEAAEQEATEELAPITRLETLIPQAMTPVYRYLAAPRSAEREQFAALSRDVNEAFRDAINGPIGPSEERELVLSAQAEWRQSQSIAEAILARSNPAGDAATARNIERADAHLGQAMGFLTRFEDLARGEIGEQLASAHAATRRAVLTFVGLLAVGLGIATLFAVTLGRSILLPLRRLQEGTRALASGDLSHRVDLATSDELGELAKTFNAMAGRLQESQEDLRNLAMHDPLTGLYNRREFFRRLSEEIERCHRHGYVLSILFLDLDDFKAVNNSLGHRAGDEVLVSLAEKIPEELRQYDILARLGGDEFAILLPQTDVDQARGVAGRVLQAVGQHIVVVEGQPVRTTVSIGIALVPQHGRTVDEVLAYADVAMFEAKDQGRNSVAVYDPQRRRQLLSQVRLDWKRRIGEALEQGLFLFHCQPIVDLRSGRTEYYELLLRMQGDQGELVLPGAFLEIAEGFGLIQDIDRWVVGEAVHLLAEHEQMGHDVRLAINLSGKALANDDMLQIIWQEIAASAINRANLVLELTETAAIADMGQAQKFVRSLKRLGCRFALDDFGVGFASFDHVKKLPVDYLKIDGSFIRHLARDQVDQHLVKAIVEVARALGKYTIAEFVEDEETLRLLRELGVDYGQGYHLGRPVPVSDVLPGLVKAKTL